MIYFTYMRNKKLIILLSVVAALVVIIIVCGATFLVRHVESYSYYENSPEEYDALVIEASGIKKNNSMFFIDEQGVKDKVEAAYPNVGVINIERKFPDRVSINYVVYGESFQYLSGDKYYQCYSSGRVGSFSASPVGGYFIVKPRDGTSQTVGEGFQSADGYDRKLMTAFIDYLHNTALNDRQIYERIDFVDLSRDGYFYIRTKAGCGIEIHGTDDVEKFGELLDKAWSAFADPKPELVDPDTQHFISRATGTIRAYINKSDGDSSVKVTYMETDGEKYYIDNYVKA